MKHRILIEFEASKPLPADFTDMVLNRVYTLDAVDKTECTATLVGDVLRDAKFDVTIEDEPAKMLKAFLTSPLDGDEDPTLIRLLLGDGHSGYGLYLAAAEYPEEGAQLLAALPKSETILDILEPDMFWDASDGESFGYDVDEIVSNYLPDEVVTIDTAKRCKSFKVRTTQDGWERVCSTIDAAKDTQ